MYAAQVDEDLARLIENGKGHGPAHRPAGTIGSVWKEE